MDQVKIGKFIAERRRKLGLTQRELADKLLISDKTVSKWECGNGLPEVALMIPLTEVLGISVNELLTGEELDAQRYQIKAEENIVKLMKEKEEARKKILIAVAVVFATLLGGITLVLVSGLAVMETWVRVLLICIAVVIIALGIGVACVLDRDAGYFVCKHCGESFVPSMKDYVMGPHTLTTRYLRCPKCGKKSYCKKTLGK